MDALHAIACAFLILLVVAFYFALGGLWYALCDKVGSLQAMIPRVIDDENGHARSVVIPVIALWPIYLSIVAFIFSIFLAGKLGKKVVGENPKKKKHNL